MINSKIRTGIRTKLVTFAWLAVAPFAGAQIVTNWAAYHDHRAGPLIPPFVGNPNSWGTRTNVTTFDIGAPADASGNLINIFNGQQLPVTLTATGLGTPDNFTTVGRPMPTNTPAAAIFFGYCDLANDGIVGVRRSVPSSVTLTFSNLNPSAGYVFRGTGGRNGGYAPRWTVATIRSAGWIDAHLNGTGPGVITSNDFPANLGTGQAAWNSGHNAQGAVVGWDFVTPFPDGTFSITCEQYVGPTPGGGAALIDNYGYSFGALLLAEVQARAPTITSNPPASTTVEQNQSFTLGVSASGIPLLYQWYKEGAPIAGATFRTYSPARAALGDSGNYFAVVYNPLGRATSTVARVTVFADTNAPSVAGAFSYPTVDVTGQTATLDQIIIEFSEGVQSNSVSSATNYVVPGGGAPTSVTVTNDRTVVLKLAAPLTPDTDYSVTVRGAVDLVGNAAASRVVPFHSWVAGPGNGLIFEAFNAGAGVEVATLIGSADYPDNPFLRTNLWIFDSRAVFPDNAQNLYGARTRGVFIPPVSGNWVFFLRTYDRGVVYLNPTGLDPAGAVEILRESTGNEPRNWDKFTSPSFFLRAGQGYYIEALYKADASTDVIKVAARLVGTGFPQPVDLSNTNLDLNSISGAAVAFPLAPRDLGGALTIARQLADVTAEQNHSATFSVEVGNPSNLPVIYKWFRDGTEIPGVTGPSYTFQPVTADNGAFFNVQMAKIGSSATSRVARLTVVADTTRPTIVSASSMDGTSVGVCFSEQLALGLLSEPLNYTVNGVDGAASSVTVRPDGKSVVLNLDPSTVLTTNFTVSVAGLADLAGNTLPEPNVVTGVVFRLAPMDVGAPTLVGSSYTCSRNEIELTAGGADIGGTSDQGHVALGARDGDFDVRVRVTDVMRSAVNAGAGLMVRETTAAESRTIHISVNPPPPGNDQITMASRDATNAATTTLGTYAPAGVPNAWLRLRRSGNTFEGYRSTNGVDWVLVGQTTQTYPVTVQVGLMATARNTGASTRATFSDYGDVVAGVAAPTLAIQRSGTNVVLSWPSSATGFVLEGSPAVTAPTWTTNAAAVVVTNSQNTVTLSATGAARYFRLRK